MDHIDTVIHKSIEDSTSDLKAQDIANRLGMSYQVLLNKANPNNEQNKLSVKEAIAIMLMTGDLRIMRAMQTELESVMHEGESKQVLEAALHVNKEVGDLNRALEETLEDGHLTLHEQERIQGEIDDIVLAIKTIRQSVKRHSPNSVHNFPKAG